MKEKIANEEDLSESNYQCRICSEAELMYHVCSTSQIFDDEEKIFLSPEVKNSEDSNHYQTALRFIQIIEFKAIKGAYSILNLLAIDRQGEFVLLSLKKSHKSPNGFQMISSIHQAFAPFTLFAFSGIIKQKEIVFSQKQNSLKQINLYQLIKLCRHLSDELMIEIVPVIAHIHKENQYLIFPMWPNLKLTRTSEMYSDQLKYVINKVYNFLGILKHIEIKKLNNFISDQLNAEALLILVDQEFHNFKVRVRGSLSFFQTLLTQNILYFRNFKIESPGSQADLQLINVGYSQIFREPQYLQPDIQNLLHKVISSIFIKSVDSLVQNQNNDQYVVTDCVIGEATFQKELSLVNFIDSNSNLVKVTISITDLAEKLKERERERIKQLKQSKKMKLIEYIN